MLSTKRFCAIRKVKYGHLWLDINTLSYDVFGCELKVKNDTDLLPNWNKDNPVIRISEVEITEIEDMECGK